MKKSPIKTPKKKESPSSTAKIATSDEISTPEKPIQLSWRSRVAFSVKEVKEIALGLQKPHKDSTDRRSNLNRSDDAAAADDDLLAVEEQLRSTSSASSDPLQKSSKTKSLIKIHPKYEILVDFFNSMDCSIRLLRLKRLLPTFANICSSIQHLTGRRFTYGHLAKLKYILPESITIKKVLLRDEATCCMKPELQVYLQTDIVESSLKQKEESDYSILRRLFRQKLAEFSREHPEADDIPEDELPHPFGPCTKPRIPSVVPRDSINPPADPPAFVTTASHMPRSFQRRFSKKTLVPDTEKASVVCFNEDTPKEDSPVPTVLSPIKRTSKLTLCKRPLFASPGPTPASSSNNVDKKLTSANKHSPHKLNHFDGTPAKLVSTPARLMATTPEIQTPKWHRLTSAYADKKLTSADKHSPHKLNHFDGTPAKLVSTPARLMAATPEIQTPKRHCLMSAYDSPVKESEKPSARTKLFPTPQKCAKIEDLKNVTISISDDDDVIDMLPETLLEEIKEKERKAVEDVDACAAAEVKSRRVMLASLPKLFDMILLIFQSRTRSTITKQELVDRIISSYLSTVDRSEVEQQLKLLQELAPDWISAKLLSNGDSLYSVNKVSSPQDIRQRLAEAK